MEDRYEIRCPLGPRRLFAVAIADGEEPVYVENGMLLELACYDCRKTISKMGEDCVRVLHYFDFLGTCVDTVIVR